MFHSAGSPSVLHRDAVQGSRIEHARAYCIRRSTRHQTAEPARRCDIIGIGEGKVSTTSTVCTDVACVRQSLLVWCKEDGEWDEE